MTPQERRLVDELFEKLATLETQPREADAEQAIMSGLRKAPNATYSLVQTVLLQDEALRRLNERVRELESRQDEQPQQSGGGFLDSMRDTLFGGGARPRSSVPPVGGSGDRPMGLPPSFGGGNPTAAGYPGQGYPGQGAPQQGGGAPQQPGPQQGGGSFLGTAAAAAVGTIGGAMLMNSLGGMFGQKPGGTATSAADLGGAKDSGAKDSGPWGGSGDASQSDLAKQAGLDNVGQSGSSDRAGFSGQQDQSQGQDQGQDQGHDQGYDGPDDDYDDMDDGDDYHFDDGDSDFA